MKKIIFLVLLLLALAMPSGAADDRIHVQSIFSVAETAARMELILKKKGMTLFNRIQHSKGAGKVGVKIGPTELIIFGNPVVGGPLMQCQQSVAIDLPQKALIWQDKQKKVWITYNDPKYLKKRHQISGCDKVIAKLEKALAGITKAAATK